MTIAWAAGPAGIRLDGTLGPSAAALSGPTYAITQNLGRLSGGNLFFSFQYFNVATGETALFTTTSAGINNVVSRVTGGYASTIDGTIELQAAAGAPNFFLINPNGVTFTSNAVIDVPAAFYVSTANFLKFSDGNFYVDPSKMSTLSGAAPEAFGFLGTTRAPVNIEGANLSAGVNGAGDFQIAAGDVTVDGGGALVGIQNSTGNIEVTAVGSASAEVPLSGPFAATDGTVTIRNGGVLLTQGQGSSNGGAIAVNAGSLLIDGLGLAINNAGIEQTGINTLTDALGAGTDSAGPITVTIGNDARLVNGGIIVSATTGPGTSGNVSLSAGTLAMDGETFAGTTGIGTVTEGTGSAAGVMVKVAGNAAIDSGAIVFSYTLGPANAGQVTVSSVSLAIDGGTSTEDTGIDSVSIPGAAGSAGSVIVDVTGSASILNGGEISCVTSGPGNSGQINAQFGSLSIDSGASDFLGGILSLAEVGSSGSAGNVNVNVTGNASITDGGQISATALGSGTAGDIKAQFGSLTIEGETSGGNVTGIQGGTVGGGSAGNIAINVAGNAAISNNGLISSSTFGAGNGGQVTLNAAGSASITNGGSVSSATYSTGNAGQVTVNVAGSASITNGSVIVSSTYGAGNAGRINAQFGSLSIDGGTSIYETGIFSDTEPTAAGGIDGSAGDVSIRVTGNASLTNGGTISSSTFGSGNAGQINAQFGSLSIDGGTSTGFTGISGITMGSGSAGDIILGVTGSTSITSGGGIESSTFGAGNGGEITAQLGSLYINNASSTAGTGFGSTAAPGASGSAGEVTIKVSGGASVLDGGAISTATFGPGNAGDIAFSAQSLAINGGTSTLGTGISSDAAQNSTGAAGRININVTGSTSIVSGGFIDTDTAGAGNAGQLKAQFGSLTMEGSPGDFTAIASEADPGSTGAAGNLAINVTHQLELESGALITIANNATVADPGAIKPTQISITAGEVQLANSSITAASSGNVAASSIDINYGSFMRMDPSTISTSAMNGNGGSITIGGAGPLLISHSNITTSVLGTSDGNGGDITINVPLVALDSGAIQANTLAPLASGGTVKINAQALVPSYQSFILGGSAVAFQSTATGLNVVQAAAADGVSGALSVTVPTLDLGNALLGLTGRPSTPVALGRGLCRIEHGSSLAVAGRGGVAPTAFDPMWIDPETVWSETSTAFEQHAVVASNGNIALGHLIACY